MTRNEAKQIAEKVTVAELKQMFINAEKGIKDWNKVSTVNSGMTKGTAFNVLSKCGISDDTHILAKINMVREFGEWLPNPYNLPKKERKKPNQVTHQQPQPLSDDFYDDIFKDI